MADEPPVEGAAEAQPHERYQLGVRAARLRVTALAMVGLLALWTVFLFTGRIVLLEWLIGVLGIKAAFVLRLLRLSALSVELTETGLTVTTFGSAGFVSWPRLELVYVSVRRRWLVLPGEPAMARRLRLVGRGPTLVVPDDIEGFSDVMERVLAVTTDNTGEAMEAAFERGEPVTFGPVTVQRDDGLWLIDERGLRFQPQWAWNAIESLPVVEGKLMLPGWVPQRLGLIPNPHILARLAESRGVDASALRRALVGEPA